MFADNDYNKYDDDLFADNNSKECERLVDTVVVSVGGDKKNKNNPPVLPPAILATFVHLF